MDGWKDGELLALALPYRLVTPWRLLLIAAHEEAQDEVNAPLAFLRRLPVHQFGRRADEQAGEKVRYGEKEK